MRVLPLLALLLVLAGPSAGKKGKKARGKKTAAKAREVEVTFTEPGPLGLDFMPEKLSGGRVGLKVKGIAPGSHASQFAQLGAGMRLVSVADDSGGVTVHTEMSAASGPELAALAKTALGDTRPITVRFSGSPKKVQPGDATALIQEGTRLGQQGRLPEAVATMERAVALKPDLAEAHYNLGIGYDRAKRGAEAVAAFRTALALKPELPKPMALTLWETAQAAAEGGAEGDAASMESCRAERGAEACEAELRSAHRLGETHRVVPLLSAADAASTRTAIYGTPLRTMCQHGPSDAQRPCSCGQRSRRRQSSRRRRSSPTRSSPTSPPPPTPPPSSPLSLKRSRSTTAARTRLRAICTLRCTQGCRRRLSARTARCGGSR